MKSILLFTVMSLFLVSCSTESLEQDVKELEVLSEGTIDNEAAGCQDAEPVVKITNNSLSAIDVQVFDKTGEIVSAQFDIAIGTSSDWLLFGAGSVRVLITIGNTSRAIPLSMDTCMEYHGTLDASNQLDTVLPKIVL